jgi:hypothetical protein
MSNENIAKALVKAQKEFGPALKTNTNPAFRSKYADLSACIEAVIDALNNNGVMLMQNTHQADDGVTVETIFLHETGESISSGKLHVPAPKQDPQGYGSALTYARRYSLMAACGIAPEDDDGNAASRQQVPPNKDSRPRSIQNTDAPKPEFTPEQLTAIQVAVDSAIDAFNAGDIAAAHDFIYGMNDNEKILEAWDRLKPHSAMRTAIKRYREANVTNQQKEAA